MTQRKGIILAGGTGTRLYPLTMAVSKQLLPVYDKPMVYYPLSVLMLAKIKEILIITTPHDQELFKTLLADGSQWGLKIAYKVQHSPVGLADAFIVAEDFLNGGPSAMVLGDHIFFGHALPQLLAAANSQIEGATVFGYHVSDPERYGVITFDSDDKFLSIVEKPEHPSSNYALTGLYFLDGTASERAKYMQPSGRGELEITTLLNSYLNDEILQVEKMGRGNTWLDTGTHASLLEASNFVRTIIERQGLQVGSPDEIAYRLNWITKEQLSDLAAKYKNNPYGQYLSKLQ